MEIRGIEILRLNRFKIIPVCVQKNSHKMAAAAFVFNKRERVNDTGWHD